jgi:hypothetical protein
MFSLPPRHLHVSVTKDGSVVLDGDASLESYTEHAMCGENCAAAQFRIQAPAELAPPERPACDVSRLTGTYDVVESGRSGGCASVLGGQTVVLSNGQLVPSDMQCQSELDAWSPSTCRAQSKTTCTSAALNVTWDLTLTDLLTDGSKLVGSGQITMRGPVACDAMAGLQLTRQ